MSIMPLIDDQDIVQAVYINLDLRADRLQHMKRLLATCPILVDRISAVRLSGSLEAHNLKVVKGVRGALAVASIWHSHKLALEFFLSCSDDGLFLLLEDDVQIREPEVFWPSLSNLSFSGPENWELILISPRYRMRVSSNDEDAKKFVGHPMGSSLNPLNAALPTHYVTGAHFCVFNGKKSLISILSRMINKVELYDVDVFYAAENQSYGLELKQVSAGGFGSDHI